ncbi:MAG: hypothetical protein OEZ51_15245, partial [Nitrospinota bacterium]|nr:hypothetical protein [Nitrospinota bacterium]
RLKKWPSLWPILLALLLCVPAIAATVFAGFLFFENIHPQWLFPYTFSWALLFVTGSWILIRWGRIKAGETLVAASWSRSKIAGAFVIALALQWSTMTALDNAAKLEAAADQTMALNRAQTILPSPPSTEEDAAEIYNQVEEEMGEVPEWLWDAATNPAFDPESEMAQSLLQDNKTTISLIKEAVQKPRLYHPLLLTFDFEIPKTAPPKNSARLLALESRTHVRNGNIIAALDNIYGMNQIAEHFNQTPTLVNVLVAGAIHVDAKKTLEILMAEKPTQSKIKPPLPLKSHDHILQSFRTGIKYENQMNVFGIGSFLIKDISDSDLYLDTFEDEAHKKWKIFIINNFAGPLYRIFLFHDDRISREHYWNEFHDFISQPYYKVKPAFKEWQEDLNESHEFGFFMSFNSPAITGYFERVTHLQTQFLLGRLGLASAAYHSDHGKYPATLDVLAPKYITEIPIDPFSGEPLKMKTMDNGLILYGVGQDLKDDGGTAFDRGTEEGDIAFYLGSAYKKYRLNPALEAMKNRAKE